MTAYSEPIRILCVDDEPNVLKAIERVFLDDDYEIVTAGSGQEGLRAIEDGGAFQLVISDYRMPVMNGVDFLKEVYERRPETVRIVLSGYADAGAIVAAINDGHIYKFMPKPWNDDELRATVMNCLDRYFLMKDNKELLSRLAMINQDLEQTVKQRTAQVEMRNQALEFSQSLLASLPVGVLGIDGTGMVATCNDTASRQLASLCSISIGMDISSSCSCELIGMAEEARTKGQVSGELTLSGCLYRVLGRRIPPEGGSSVVLVIIEP